MINKGSRYETSRFFSKQDSSALSFEGVRPRQIDYAEGVLEHVVIEGDRLDLLALYYYNDVRRWWRILDANPDILCGTDLTLNKRVGSVILIPRSKGVEK